MSAYGSNAGRGAGGGGGGGGANRTLSNLIDPTAINADLLPDTDRGENLGSSDLHWNQLFISSIHGTTATPTTIDMNAGGALVDASQTISLDWQARTLTNAFASQVLNYMSTDVQMLTDLDLNQRSVTDLSAGFSAAPLINLNGLQDGNVPGEVNITSGTGQDVWIVADGTSGAQLRLGGSGNGVGISNGVGGDIVIDASNGGGAVAFNSNINGGSNNAINFADPVNPQDLATKAYVDSATPSLSVGTFGSTPNAGGGVFSGATLTLEPADGTHPGGVSTTTQTFAGQKTFSTGLTGTLTGHATLDLALSGGTLSGVLNMGSHTIDAVTDPSTAQQAATKNYVDTMLAALNPAAACFAATTANIAGTYNNGAGGVGATFTTTATGTFTVDGATPALGARILIKDQSAGLQNGIYTITTLGTTGVQTVFTRAADYNTAADMNTAGLIPIQNGTSNALSSWQQIAVITTVGTDALSFSEFTANPSLYVLKANNLTDLASRQTSLNNLAGAVTNHGVLKGDGTNMAVGLLALTDLPSIGANTILGNNTGGSATPSALTVAQTQTLLGVPTASSPLPLNAGGTGTSAASANAAFNALSPLTTKGDVVTFGTVNQRHAVPGDYGRLAPDSAQTDGWKSAAYNQYLQGKPGKNYIQYADFDNQATTGWSLGTIGTLVNGLPTGSPTFGSGASGNLSISAVTSGTLGGIASLSLASSAATTAGNMVASQAYTIDIEDQAKVLSFRAYYQASSGVTNLNLSGTASNSVAVGVWDVTNSVWLAVAGAFNFVQSTGVGVATGTLQTGVTTTSVRLCVYFPNASAGAATLLFKDFYLGPQITQQAPAMSDWTAYTPVVGGTSSAPTPGTGSTYVGYWRREGDSVRIRQEFQQTSTTGAAAGSGDYLFPLPSGMVADLNKINTTPGLCQQCVGAGESFSAADTQRPASVQLNDASNFKLMCNTAGSGFVSSTFHNFNGNASVRFGFEAIVPIVGWSSNSVASSDTDTRVIACRAYASGTQSISSGSVTKLTINTVDFDTAGAFDPVTNSRYTVTVSGIYDVTAFVNFAANATGTRSVYVFKNGSSIGQATTSGNTLDGASPQFSTTLKLSAGDYLELSCFQDSGGALSTSQGFNSVPAAVITVRRLSGPAVITATESVNGRYYSSTSSLSGSDAAIVYATKDFDSHNAYNTGTGTLTIPVSGKYQFNAAIRITSTYTANQSAAISIYKNSTQISGTTTQAGTSITVVSVNVSDIVSCLAGDQIVIEASSGGTSPSISASNQRNYFSWARVGN